MAIVIEPQENFFANEMKIAALRSKVAIGQQLGDFWVHR